MKLLNFANLPKIGTVKKKAAPSGTARCEFRCEVVENCKNPLVFEGCSLPCRVTQGVF